MGSPRDLIGPINQAEEGSCPPALRLTFRIQGSDGDGERSVKHLAWHCANGIKGSRSTRPMTATARWIYEQACLTRVPKGSGVEAAWLAVIAPAAPISGSRTWNQSTLLSDAGARSLGRSDQSRPFRQHGRCISLGNRAGPGRISAWLASHRPLARRNAQLRGHGHWLDCRRMGVHLTTATRRNHHPTRRDPARGWPI